MDSLSGLISKRIDTCNIGVGARDEAVGVGARDEAVGAS